MGCFKGCFFSSFACNGVKGVGYFIYLIFVGDKGPCGCSYFCFKGLECGVCFIVNGVSLGSNFSLCVFYCFESLFKVISFKD